MTNPDYSSKLFLKKISRYLQQSLRLLASSGATRLPRASGAIPWYYETSVNLYPVISIPLGPTLRGPIPDYLRPPSDYSIRM